jgi:hypothetical protein
MSGHEDTKKDEDKAAQDDAAEDLELRDKTADEVRGGLSGPRTGDERGPAKQPPWMP